MTSKQRVIAAINHEEPDKVPLDSWMAKELKEEISSAFHVNNAEDYFALQKFLGHDILYKNIGFCDGYQSIYDKELRVGDNIFEDRFGILWKKEKHDYGSYCEFVSHPLEDLNKWDNYVFPDPIETTRKGLEIYKKLIDEDGNDYAIVGGVACTIFEGAWYLRGMQNFLMDLIERRDFAEELLDACMKFSLVLSKELVKMGVDIIWWGDDLSTEKGPMISPQLVRELIFSRYAQMISEVKAINKNVKIAFHSDGNIEWMLDDLIDLGVDIINPLQPDANNVSAVKNRYGKNLTVWGNVDTRNVMSFGQPRDVIREVEQVITTLGHGGGLLLSTNHTIQARPNAFDNTLAYYYAADKFREYPLIL